MPGSCAQHPPSAAAQRPPPDALPCSPRYPEAVRETRVVTGREEVLTASQRRKLSPDLDEPPPPLPLALTLDYLADALNVRYV